MGLKTLNNTGDTFIDEIFDDVITIYEDVQGSKLLVRYDGDNFEFRAKSINNDPISLVDLSLQKYYNKAINFFYGLDDRVKKLLPKKWHFCFEYFPDEQPAHIEYKKSPKNNLILTGIVKGKKFKYSIEELLEFSNLFDVDPLPIIFHGKLNQKQKEGIKYFLHTSKEDLEYIFGDQNFAFFFYKLLDPTHKHSFLMDENEYQPNLQRLIIRTNSNDYRYEVLNPLYKKSSETIDTDFTDIYSLILLNFLSYIQNINLDDIKLSGVSYDEVYLNLISRLYNMYMNDMSEELDEFQFDIPKFFNKEKFKINIDFITNQLTQKYISENQRFEYIFKCILGSFRDKKKKAIGIFTKNSLLLFNNFIENINKRINLHLNKVKEDELRNSQLMNFGDYYNFKYDTDGEGKVYPDVYTEFETPSEDKKKKKSKKFTDNNFDI
jgi:hypothetical protein